MRSAAKVLDPAANALKTLVTGDDTPINQAASQSAAVKTIADVVQPGGQQSYRPGSATANALNETDDYPQSRPGDPLALRSLQQAAGLVVLQALAVQALPEAFRDKARVIFQSCVQRQTLHKTARHLRVVMVGHLREEKNPRMLWRAVRAIAPDAGILVDHIGDALEPALACEAQQVAGLVLVIERHVSVFLEHADLADHGLTPGKRQELGPDGRVRLEQAPEGRGHGLGPRLADAPAGHAEVGRLDHDTTDEPMAGMGPEDSARMVTMLRKIKGSVTILLIEQNAKLALQVSQRGYVMESGEITFTGDSADLLDDPKVRAAYLGE